MRYPWPGNIRELRNACENLAVLRAGRTVGPADLDPRFSAPALAAGLAAPALGASGNLDRTLNEKQLLKQANLCPSSSDALRMVEQGGVRIDGATVSYKALKVDAGTFVVQVGKRKFARVTLS